MSSIPRVSAADVERIIRRDFASELRPEAARLLELYQSNEPHRVRLAVLKLAQGNLTRLTAQVENARMDFRDVLMWAEYPAYSRLPFSAAESDRRAADESDRDQYQRWLDG